VPPLRPGGVVVSAATNGRHHGMSPWSPDSHTLHILKDILDVLDEERSEWPLGPRSMEYRLLDKGYLKTLLHHPSIGPSPWSKTHKRKRPSTPDNGALYTKVLDVLARGRRSGRIPWEAVADDFSIADHHHGYASPDAFWAMVEELADDYEPVLLAGQSVVPELWCEARGMTARVRTIAHEYGVSVYSSGGSDHLKPKRDLALRVVRRIGVGKRTAVLHVGDHDDKGVEIFEVLRDDVTTMVRDRVWREAADRLDDDAELASIVPWLDFRRLAITAERAEELRLLGKHQGQEAKSGRWKVQAEAMAPHDRAELIRAALESCLDMDLIEQTREGGEQHRAAVLQALATLALTGEGFR
jgi:hypothetical protein